MIGPCRPQRLKPNCQQDAFGTAKAVPLSKTSSAGNDRDAGLVCGGDDGGGIEEERLPCFDGEAGGACGLHGVDGGDADHGYVEAHVLIGFGYFDDGEGAAKGGRGWICWSWICRFR